MMWTRPPAELSALCENEHPRLVRLLVLYSGNHDLAEEVAQETIVRLCRDWEKVRRLDHPPAWLHRVAINTMNSAFRRRAAERRANVKFSHSNTQEPLEVSDMELIDALKDLPPRQRAVVLLRHHLRFTTRETAETLGCPEGTVKTLLFKAVRSLRESGAISGKEPSDV